MITSISMTLAQQIVDTIHDVCGYDINFINPEGRIYASTDPERIGTFHEIGRTAARSGSTIEVNAADSFVGTKEGINIPIYYHHNVIAVVGITAEPEEARRYAHLAERVTTMFLREQELNERSRNIEEQKLYVIRCLQEGTFDNHEYFDECMKKFHLDPHTQYRMVCMEINTRYNLVNISLLEQHVRTLFDTMRQEVFAYIYPHQFAGLIEREIYEKNLFVLRKFAEGHRAIVKTAVGSNAFLSRCSESWQNALTAMTSIKDKEDADYVCFDDLDLEILLSGLKGQNKTEFAHKILKELSPEERKFLKVYYGEDMSLKKTSEKLFLHKNTVQQRLNRIASKTGRDPRMFREAVLYYLAGQI